MTPEQQARVNIDRLLEQAGWAVQNADSINLYASSGVAVREFALKPGHGHADYLLYVNQKVAGVVEAKPEGFTLTGVEIQSEKYSTGLPDTLPAYRRPLPFLYESTGTETQFTNGLDPEPRSRPTFSFHTPETLARWIGAAGTGQGANSTQGMIAEPTGTYLTSNNLRQRLKNMLPLDASGLWPVQERAIKNLEESMAAGRPRALVQMATGSGKTFMACNQVYRLIKYGGARRVLFLVDRSNLGRQTLREFQGFSTPGDERKFTELYNVQLLQSSRIDLVSRVCIATIQRVYSMLKGEELDPELEELSGFDLAPLQREPAPVEYNPDIPIETFDVIITDECHRSIYNLWRQVLEYFDAFLIGLTATPSKQTFGFFNQNLVMEYNHEQAVADGVNVDFDVYRINTEITQQGSSVEAGYYVDKRDRQTTGLDDPPKEAVAQAQQQLLEEAAQPFASNPQLRQLLVDIRRSYEQTIDTVSANQLIEAGFSADATDRAHTLVQSFKEFIQEHRDEITALQVLYQRPYRQRLSYADIKALADAVQLPPRTWTTDRLWQAYRQLDQSKVRGSGQRVLADIVSLVRYAIGETYELAPFADRVHERFRGWLAMQETAGRSFTAEQRRWLEAIRDPIAGSVSIELNDFQYAPFNQQGGLVRAHALFGEELPRILEELNLELVA